LVLGKKSANQCVPGFCRARVGNSPHAGAMRHRIHIAEIRSLLPCVNPAVAAVSLDEAAGNQ
jgi:hypothetical protein